MRVLVAEDDEAITDALELILGSEGYDVLTARNTSQINTALQQNPDIVLLDIRLSGVDGRDVCEQLKLGIETTTLPIILMSANPDVDDIACAVHADGFIRKPFEMSRLLQMLKQYAPSVRD